MNKSSEGRWKNTNKQYIITIILIVFVGAGAFFAGMKYQQSKRQQQVRFGNFQQGQRLRSINGEIISVDDKSVTIKLQDGSSKILLLTDNSVISKSSEATKDDLKVGEKVAAFGTENSDGSVTSQNIQLNPQFRGNFINSPSR